MKRPREAAQSCPVDLDEVAAQLHTVSVDTERSIRWPSTPPEERYVENLGVEAESYLAPVNAGGRPPYPFHLSEEQHFPARNNNRKAQLMAL